MISAPRGTKDILPDESYRWQFIEDIIHKVCARMSFKEIRIPVFENTELFERGVGNETDVVQKEMYTFLDKGDRSITLRPEGTAGVVRSFIEKSLYALPQPTKLYYTVSCYRYEKPEAGRLREFHQFGCELFGSADASADAEVIALADSLLKELGLGDLQVRLNSVGCPTCRNSYNEKLMEYLDGKRLCDTCEARKIRNPMRILDCKEDDCKAVAAGAPRITDCICEECREHFTSVQKYLSASGIKFQIDKDIVRGLDYYTKTVFEIVSDKIKGQATVCGGGRYDNMVESLGGKPTPGIGFGLGIERLLLTIEASGIAIPPPNAPDLFICTRGDDSDLFAAELTAKLRGMGFVAEKDLLRRSLKAQMKYADKIGAKHTMVIGQDELESGISKLKRMDTGEEREVSLDRLDNWMS